MDTQITTMEDFGYDDFFASHRAKLGGDVLPIARVVAEHRGAYQVKNTEGEYLAKVTGKHMFQATSREDYPAVGDFVTISVLSGNQAVIESVLPRKTVMKRKYSGKDETQIIAANVDVVFVIESFDRDYNLNRFERYFAIASDGGIRPAIIFNKTDLIAKEELEARIAEIKVRFKDIDVITTSTVTDEGLDTLKAYILKGKTYCFLGSSGVGKSSLINRLLDQEKIKTGMIGEHSGRGTHTTTAREMYFLANGGIVIDNPGVREVGLTDAEAGVESLFDEVTILAQACKFVDCTHMHEPGCGVLAAVQSGALSQEAYANYLVLKKESEHYALTTFKKREKDRQRGKVMKKMKQELKRYSHKDYGDQI